MYEWVIKKSAFEARIDISRLAFLPMPNIRKLLKLSKTADNPESLPDFVRMLPEVVADEVARLGRLKAGELKRSDVIGFPGYQAYDPRGRPGKERDEVRSILVKEQARRITKLMKIQEKELKNYVN